MGMCGCGVWMKCPRDGMNMLKDEEKGLKERIANTTDPSNLSSFLSDFHVFRVKDS